jgi:hypothetical protein
MAQRLQSTDSAERCINSGNRHTRLCSQAKGTESLIASIKPVIATCTVKQEALKAATKELDESYDLWIFMDGLLDKAVKNTASRCKEFDRDNPGPGICLSIFPEGTEVITKENRENEPDIVDNLAVRFENLGSEHELFSCAAKLREAAQKSRDACNSHKQIAKKVDIAKTELDIAKSELINQYISNMLDAEKSFGRDFANRLFPILRSSGSSEDDSKEQEKLKQ